MATSSPASPTTSSTGTDTQTGWLPPSACCHATHRPIPSPPAPDAQPLPSRQPHPPEPHRRPNRPRPRPPPRPPRLPRPSPAPFSASRCAGKTSILDYLASPAASRFPLAAATAGTSSSRTSTPTLWTTASTTPISGRRAFEPVDAPDSSLPADAPVRESPAPLAVPPDATQKRIQRLLPSFHASRAPAYPPHRRVRLSRPALRHRTRESSSAPSDPPPPPPAAPSPSSSRAAAP